MPDETPLELDAESRRAVDAAVDAIKAILFEMPLEVRALAVLELVTWLTDAAAVDEEQEA